MNNYYMYIHPCVLTLENLKYGPQHLEFEQALHFDFGSNLTKTQSTTVWVYE